MHRSAPSLFARPALILRKKLVRFSARSPWIAAMHTHRQIHATFRQHRVHWRTLSAVAPPQRSSRVKTAQPRADWIQSRCSLNSQTGECRGATHTLRRIRTHKRGSEISRRATTHSVLCPTVPVLSLLCCCPAMSHSYDPIDTESGGGRSASSGPSGLLARLDARSRMALGGLALLAVVALLALASSSGAPAAAVSPLPLAQLSRTADVEVATAATAVPESLVSPTVLVSKSNAAAKGEASGESAEGVTSVCEDPNVRTNGTARRQKHPRRSCDRLRFPIAHLLAAACVISRVCCSGCCLLCCVCAPPVHQGDPEDGQGEHDGCFV